MVICVRQKWVNVMDPMPLVGVRTYSKPPAGAFAQSRGLRLAPGDWGQDGVPDELRSKGLRKMVETNSSLLTTSCDRCHPTPAIKELRPER